MDHLFSVHYSFLIPLLPLIGAAVSGFFGARWLRGQSHWPIWLGVGASAVLSFLLLFGMFRYWEQGPVLGASDAAAVGQVAQEGHPTLSVTRIWFDWISAGDPATAGVRVNQRPLYFHVPAGTFIDPLTAVMLCVVTGVGFFITVFSKGYMAGEDGYFRFFAYLGLFIFSMTMLVMGENLLTLYLGWEGVGLCSYLLIGYYYDRPSARNAATKAFLVNRVGDFGFAIGIMLCFLVFGTVSYFGAGPNTVTGVLTKAASPEFIAQLAPWQKQCVYWIPFCLLLGAVGKSAQFPLYVWLPDAMEGPTPVSALIHAATMVTAGVYMIARCGTLFFSNHAVLVLIAVLGALTAALAAVIAMRQFDLKKVFAYSTISQLGYMFVAMAVLAPVAGVFHLVTHAFFKAVLFLGSGVVMHAMAGELDMRKMSGLRRVLPVAHWCMLFGCLALAGFPFVSGYFSKDDIVAAAFSYDWALGAIMLATSFLTAYYTFRLFFRVFWGPLVVPGGPAPAYAHGHEPHEDAAASESAVHTGTSPSSGVDVAQTRHAPAHDDDHGHNHEPMSMALPLIVLALGAIAAGYLNWPERDHSLGGFLSQSPSLVLGFKAASAAAPHAVNPGHFGLENPGAQHQPYFTLTMIVGGLVSIAGILLAAVMHLWRRQLADQVARAMGGLTTLVENKFYVDEIYQALVVSPLRLIARSMYAFDRYVIDGIIGLVTWVPQLFGFSLKLTVQRGYLQGYATAMLFGIMIILLLIFLR